jgi:hypothetical protein
LNNFNGFHYPIFIHVYEVLCIHSSPLSSHLTIPPPDGPNTKVRLFLYSSGWAQTLDPLA